MGARTTAREAALQLLYAVEASDESQDHVVREFWKVKRSLWMKRTNM